MGILPWVWYGGRAGVAVLYSVVVGAVREFWVKTAAADVKVHEIPLETEGTPESGWPGGATLPDESETLCGATGGNYIFGSEGLSSSDPGLKIIPSPSGSWEVYPVLAYDGVAVDPIVSDINSSGYNALLDFTTISTRTRLDELRVSYSGQSLLRRSDGTGFPINSTTFAAFSIGYSKPQPVQTGEFSGSGGNTTLNLSALNYNRSTCFAGPSRTTEVFALAGNNPNNRDQWASEVIPIADWLAACNSSYFSWSVSFIYRNLSTAEIFPVTPSSVGPSPLDPDPIPIPNPYESFASALKPKVFALIKSNLDDSDEEFGELAYKQLIGETVSDLGSTASGDDWRGDALSLTPTASITNADSCIETYLDTEDGALINGILYRINLDQTISGNTLRNRLQTSSDTVTATLTTQSATSGASCTLDTATTSTVQVPSPGRGTIEGITYIP